MMIHAKVRLAWGPEIRRNLIILAGIAGILTAAPALTANILYHRALSALGPSRIQPPADELSPSLRDIAWVEFEGTSPSTVRPTGPARFAAVLLIESWLGTPDRSHALPGLRLAGRCAQSILQRSGRRAQFHYHVQGAALSIWLSRNWTTEQVIACGAVVGPFGPGLNGIEEAAETYFGRPPAELSHDEAALLLVALRSPWQFERDCDPAGLSRKVEELLSRLQTTAIDAGRRPELLRAGVDRVWLEEYCVRSSDPEPKG